MPKMGKMGKMGKDFFSAELRSVTGQPLPCIETDGQRCFVGEPGQEFVVAVTASLGSGLSCEAHLRVDGQSPGYAKIFWANTGCKESTSTFDGWLQRAGDSTSYKRFKLGACRPGEAAATVSNPDDMQAGRIEVLLVQVEDTGTRKQQAPAPVAAGPSRDAASKKLPEGKKWFLAPGLKAEAGSTVAAKTTWTRKKLKKVGELPSLHMRYDSSEALYLRKALNPRFAPHRAILRKSANPAIAALGIEPDTAPPAPSEATSRPNLGGAAAAAAGGAGRVKREAAGVKRERGAAGDDDDDYVPRSATAERIDLTEEPVRPMCVNGRQVAPDELAVCDLCDSDEEGAAAPRWQVKKKQHVDVEV